MTIAALLLCVAWAFSWHGAWYQRLKLPDMDVLSIEEGVLWWYRTDIGSASAMPAFPTLHSWEIGRFPVFGLLDAPWLVPTRVAFSSMRVYAIPFHARCASDTNDDGSIDGDDIIGFVGALVG